MENSSQAPHSGGSPWKGLLITASILSCWIQPSSAQSVSGVPNPPYGTVGSSVILDIQGLSGQPLSYTWYRKEVEPSNQIAYYNAASGQLILADSRLNVFSNGSLLISNLRLTDNENYNVQLINSNAQIQIIQGSLVVYERASKPTISANGTSVMEKSTLVFTCITEHQGINILWFFNKTSLSLSERKYLSKNNQTLTTRNVMREDSGSYHCEVWNPISAKRSDPLTLTVNYGPDNIVFSPNPVRDEIQITFKNSLILVCHVESYPPAQYEWQVNGTVNSNFFDNTYTIKNPSLKDSGKYACLAWNNMTNLSVSKDITIRVVGAITSFTEGTIAGIVIGVLTGVALIGAFIYFFFSRKTGRESKHHYSEKSHSALKHGEDTTLYENTACLKDSAVSEQDLSSSPAFPQVPSESPYQALDTTQVDVYSNMDHWKNSQVQKRGKNP